MSTVRDRDKERKIVEEVAKQMRGASWQEIAWAAETRIREETGRSLGMSGVLNNYGDIILGNSSNQQGGSGGGSGKNNQGTNQGSGGGSGGNNQSANQGSSGGGSNQGSNRRSSSGGNNQSTNQGSGGGSGGNNQGTNQGSGGGSGTEKPEIKYKLLENQDLKYQVTIERTPDGKWRTVLIGDSGEKKELSVRSSLEEAEEDAKRYVEKPKSAFKDVNEYLTYTGMNVAFVDPEKIAKEFDLYNQWLGTSRSKEDEQKIIEAIKSAQDYIFETEKARSREYYQQLELEQQKANILADTINKHAPQIVSGAMRLEDAYKEAVLAQKKLEAEKKGDLVVFSMEDAVAELKKTYGPSIEEYLKSLQKSIQTQKNDTLVKTGPSQTSSSKTEIPYEDAAKVAGATMLTALPGREFLWTKEGMQWLAERKPRNEPTGWIDVYKSPYEEWYKLTGLVEEKLIPKLYGNNIFKDNLAIGKGILAGFARGTAQFLDVAFQIIPVYGLWNTFTGKQKININTRLEEMLWKDLSEDESFKPIPQIFVEQPIGILSSILLAPITQIQDYTEKLQSPFVHETSEVFGLIGADLLTSWASAKGIYEGQKLARNIKVANEIPMKVPADSVFSPEVLSGKKTFPTSPTAEESFLKFKATKTIGGGKVIGVHAAPQDYFGNIFIVKAGPESRANKQDLIMFFAPYGHGSPYFLRIDDSFSFSLNPLDTVNLFKKREPTAVAVRADDILRPPEKYIKAPGFEAINEWYSRVNNPAESWKPGDPLRFYTKVPSFEELDMPDPRVLYQTKRSIIRHTWEDEAGKPQGTLMRRINPEMDVRVNIKGWEVPVKFYEAVSYTLLEPEAKDIVPKIKGLKTYTPPTDPSSITTMDVSYKVPISLTYSMRAPIRMQEVGSSYFESAKQLKPFSLDYDQKIGSPADYQYLKNPTAKSQYDFVYDKKITEGSYIEASKEIDYPKLELKPLRYVFIQRETVPEYKIEPPVRKTSEYIKKRDYIDINYQKEIDINYQKDPVPPQYPSFSLKGGSSVPEVDYNFDIDSNFKYSFEHTYGPLDIYYSYSKKQKQIERQRRSKKESEIKITLKSPPQKARLPLYPKAELYLLQKEDIAGGLTMSKIGQHPLPSQKKAWLKVFNQKMVGFTRSMLSSKNKGVRF